VVMEDAATQMDGEPVCLDARASIASRVAKMSLPSIIDHRLSSSLSLL
jgi:hypothetical protein